MSFLPKEMASSGDVVILDNRKVIDALKALIVQKLKAHFTDKPNDDGVNNFWDARRIVIDRIVNPDAKAKVLAVNPARFNQAWDELLAEGVLVFVAPKETVEEEPDLDDI